MHRTSGRSKNSSAIGTASPGACVMTLITPGGNPASAMISATSSPAVTGASSDGLRTTVLPKASGLTTVRQASTCAPFHGEIPATTPSGRRSASANVPGHVGADDLPSGQVAPVGRLAQQPGRGEHLEAGETGRAAGLGGQQRGDLGRARSTMSAARRNKACFSAGGRSAQPGKAAAAASTARAASALVPAGMRAMTVPRYGSRSSNISVRCRPTGRRCTAGTRAPVCLISHSVTTYPFGARAGMVPGLQPPKPVTILKIAGQMRAGASRGEGGHSPRLPQNARWKAVHGEIEGQMRRS